MHPYGKYTICRSIFGSARVRDVSVANLKVYDHQQKGNLRCKAKSNNSANGLKVSAHSLQAACNDKATYISARWSTPTIIFAYGQYTTTHNNTTYHVGRKVPGLMGLRKIRIYHTSQSKPIYTSINPISTNTSDYLHTHTQCVSFYRLISTYFS